jgi:hypothetical protein
MTITLAITNQKGGVFPLLAAIASPTLLLTKINLALAITGKSCGDIPLMLANYFTINPGNAVIVGITNLIKAIENPFTFGWDILIEKVGYQVVLECIHKVTTGIYQLIDCFKGIPSIFFKFMTSIFYSLYENWMITLGVLSLIIFMKSTYYKRGVEILKLDRNIEKSEIFVSQ